MKDLVKKIGTPKVAFFIAAALALIVIFGMMMTSNLDKNGGQIRFQLLFCLWGCLH
jgi:hypothetical protein